MTEQEIADSILHVLSIYPKISNSMLQIGIGTHIRPKDWRPVLSRLVEEGQVQVTSQMIETAKGRTHTYSFISLAG